MIRIRNVSHHTRAQPILEGTACKAHKNQVRVYTGDIATSTRPLVLHTLLGSCVTVCLYDEFLRAGGMNHMLLPGHHMESQSTRFGVHAMEVLINELMKQGGDRRRFVAKAFGGANVMPGLTTATVGDDNASFVREFLATERIPLVAQRLGGRQAIHVFFRTDTGRVTVHPLDGSQPTKIIRAESAYWRSHHAGFEVGGDVTLF